MQPIQIQCGHCGRLMAVSSEHRGQHVRCPHCQQIVIAPPPDSPTLPSPILEQGKATAVEAEAPPGLADTTLHIPSPESIFSPVEVGSDLFGRGNVPRIEMPSDTMPPTLPGDSVVPPPQPQLTTDSTLPWAPQQPSTTPPSPLAPFAPGESTALLSGGGTPPWSVGSLTELLSPPPAQAPPPADSPPFVLTKTDGVPGSGRERRQTETKAPWFLLLVFCPLLLYSIVISIFSFFLYRHHQQFQEQFRERFDKMPDVGDDPGVRKGKKVTLTDRYKPELATLPLPDYLCTTLGKSLRIGELQVTPNRVERKRVAVVVGAARPEPCQNDSLVLYLDLKNLSTEYAFAPLDNYFDRYWRSGEGLIPPLTQLEIGNKYRCYGGPARWYSRSDDDNPRQWVQGRHDQADRLGPGEEKEMFVCTDGDDAKAAALLFGDQPSGEYHGPLLWRVRIRRGLVRFQDKDYPATAVIGVRFTDADIREGVPE